MPGYGIQAADEGGGLLPWAWATERLERSHDYWVATTRPDGAPHVMPVWGIWSQEALRFSSSRSARKARNLVNETRCVITTDDALEPVVIEGRASPVDDPAELAHFAAATNAKYSTDYAVEFFTSPDNVCFRVRPLRVIGLDSADFTGSPTRWDLD
jgi:nitroimidazol reductase NimA-like FMN-containing flavoprotein (pyridoxamine 5'-phosphate oxidase superfamily)